MMTAFKRKVVHYDQRGFTLAELLIAIAITALIGAAVATAVFKSFVLMHRVPIARLLSIR
jgi:prepilin-type N-terminal cleavage/methylation domain-containing protein